MTMRKTEDSKLNPRAGALRWLRRETFGNLFLITMMFGLAGTWRWPMGWAFCGIYLIWSLGNVILVLPKNSAMLAERARPHPDRRRWDEQLLYLMGFLMTVEYVTAGLDLRFTWTQPFSLPVQLAGFLLAFIGFDVLMIWAMQANAFFVALVRIQSEREQKPVSSGPYRFVRHPGYLGTIMLHLGVPFMLNSSWAIIPGLLAVVVLVLRTYKEDQTLQAELAGYREYAERVPWRLFPGIW